MTLSRLLWVADRSALESEVAVLALGGGLRFVYLRDPSIDREVWDRRRVELGEVAPELEGVVPGGPSWALEAGLGAHFKAAQSGPAGIARRRWSRLGRSVHDGDELRRALEDSPDYLVAGPVFPTASKPGHPGIGRKGLRAIVEASEGCPVFAIGGLTPQRVGDALEDGAYGVAVRSGIAAAEDPAAAVRAYLAALPVDAGES